MFDFMKVAEIGEQIKQFVQLAAQRLDMMERQQQEILRLLRALESRIPPPTVSPPALTDVRPYYNDRSL